MCTAYAVLLTWKEIRTASTFFHGLAKKCLISNDFDIQLIEYHGKYLGKPGHECHNRHLVLCIHNNKEIFDNIV